MHAIARPRVRSIWAAGALGFALTASAALAAPHGFEFSQLRVMVARNADAAAQAFVADHIRPGMPLGEAMHVARAAGAPCHRPRDSGEPIVCSYTYFDQRPTGDLDEDEWRIEIVPRPDGTVDSAEVGLARAGL